MNMRVSASTVGGSISAPASKSSMQRAIACAAFASGRSVLRNPSYSADCLAALRLVESLGAGVRRLGDRLLVDGGLAEAGRGASASRAEGPRRLSCGESGLCIRMFSSLAAVLPGETLLEAEGSLRSRPLSMVDGALEPFGGSAASSSGLPPVRVRGPLRGGRGRIDASSSSQFVTGLLLALPLAPEDSSLEAGGLVSSGYVDLTLDTMRAFGVEVERPAASSGDARDLVFAIRGGQRYAGCEFDVEGDWSGAAFLLVAGAIAAVREPLCVSGLKLDSSQPDRAVLRALVAAGATLREEGDRVWVARAGLAAFSFDATDCPDLFPPLVALAALCRGDSLIRGAGRLRHKESDRAAALSEEFAALGVGVRVEGDLMRVSGRPALAGGAVDARGDHRIAMAAAVAALASEAPVEIAGADCVAKSWPTFFEDLDSVRDAPSR